MDEPQVTGNFLSSPGWDSNIGSGERQLAVSGNSLDHMAMRVKYRDEGSILKMLMKISGREIIVSRKHIER